MFISFNSHDNSSPTGSLASRSNPIRGLVTTGNQGLIRCWPNISQLPTPCGGSGKQSSIVATPLLDSNNVTGWGNAQLVVTTPNTVTSASRNICPIPPINASTSRRNCVRQVCKNINHNQHTPYTGAQASNMHRTTPSESSATDGDDDSGFDCRLDELYDFDVDPLEEYEDDHLQGYSHKP